MPMSSRGEREGEEAGQVGKEGASRRGKGEAGGRRENWKGERKKEERQVWKLVVGLVVGRTVRMGMGRRLETYSL